MIANGRQPDGKAGVRHPDVRHDVFKPDVFNDPVKEIRTRYYRSA